MQDSNSPVDTASSSGSRLSEAGLQQRQQFAQKFWPRLPPHLKAAYENRSEADKQAVCVSYWNQLKNLQHLKAARTQQGAQTQQNSTAASPTPASTSATPITQRAPSPLSQQHQIPGQHGSMMNTSFPSQNATNRGPSQSHQQQLQQQQQQQQRSIPHAASAAHLQQQNAMQPSQGTMPTTSHSPAPQYAYPNFGPANPQQQVNTQQHGQQYVQHRSVPIQQQGQQVASSLGFPMQGMGAGQQGRGLNQSHQALMQQNGQGHQADRAKLLQAVQGMTPDEHKAQTDAYFQSAAPSGPTSGAMHMPTPLPHQQQMTWPAAQQLSGMHQPFASQALASRPKTPGGGVRARPASGLGHAAAGMHPAASTALSASAPQAGLPGPQGMPFPGQIFPSAQPGMGYTPYGQPVYSMPGAGQAPARVQQGGTGSQTGQPGQVTPNFQAAQQQVIQQQRLIAAAAAAAAPSRPASAAGPAAASQPRRPARGRGREAGGPATKPPRKKPRVEGQIVPAADSIPASDSLTAAESKASGAMTHESLERLLERAVAPGNKLTGSAEAAVLQLVDDFVAGATASGCGLARQRKTGRLESADIAVYLERTWRIHVPGFSSGAVPVAPAHLPSTLHETRQAAVHLAESQASPGQHTILQQ